MVQAATPGNNNGVIAVHGTAQDSFGGVPPGNPLPLTLLEQRLVAPGELFDKSGKRTLRANSTGGLNGTVGYDAPNSINWTATYIGLSAADVTRALAAESRGMWLGNAVLPAGEITTYEIGAAIIPGPQAPCSAPLESLPPPAGADFAPPSIPADVHADNNGTPNTITIDWLASTDTENGANDNPGVTSYGVYRINGVDGIPVAIANVQNLDGTAAAPTLYIDKNVPPGTYTYKVDSADSLGNRSALSAASPEVTAEVQNPPNVEVNEPPANGHALLAFPSRDFVSAENYAEDELVNIEIIRNNIVISTAEGLIPVDADPETPAFEGIVEVNHPGGACWDGVTPELRAGDIVRATAFGPGAVVRSIDQIHVANVTAKKAVRVSPEGVFPATIQIYGTAQDADGRPIQIDQLEQRLIGTSRDPFGINGRRALRADSVGAGDGTLSYDTQNNASGIKWTATYTGLDEHDLALALDVESRILWLGREPLAGNELTLFEVGLADPPGPSTGFCSAPIEHPDDVSPTRPGSFSANVNNPAGEVRFTWANSSDDWSIAGYKIFDGSTEVAITKPDDMDYTLRNVAPGSHIYTLRAFDHASPLAGTGDFIARLTAGLGNPYGNLSTPAVLTTINGQPSEDGALTLTDVAPPTPPTNLVATVSPGQIHLSWTESADNVGVDHYIVHRNPSSPGSPEDFTVTGNITSFTDGSEANPLDVDTYRYTVEAVDAAGNPSGPSDPLDVVLTTDNDLIPPDAPTGVAAVVGPDPIHGNNVTLTWTAAVDAGGVAAHKIYRSNNGAAEALIATVSGTTVTYTDANLPAGTYLYTITGVDLHGNVSVHSAPPATAMVANDVPPAGHSLIGFPARDFISAEGYNPNPQHNYHFDLYRGNIKVTSDRIENAQGDTAGIIEVNHPGGTCWTVNTPDIRAGDVIRIVDETTGIADQTKVANVTAERPIAINANTVIIRGTAQQANGQPIPIAQLEQRLVTSSANPFDLNGRRALRAAAGSDGTLSYDTVNNPAGTKWTAVYTGLSANDLLRAVGGTNTAGTVFPGAESRIVWLGRDPLAGTELTIFENGSGVSGGPSAPCTAPAENLVAAASLAPAGIAFPSTSFNPSATSATRTITLSNGGGAPLTLTNIYFAGANPGDFIRTAGGSCPTAFPANLPAGASCTVNVQFRPAAFELRQANLSFTGNAANTTDLSVALTGTGTDASDPLIAPINPVAFGTINGGGSSTRAVTIVNNGSGLALSVSSVSIAGANPSDFSVSSQTCTGSSLAANGGSCTVNLVFRPGARGARSATLVLNHNRALPNSATSTSVALNGTGGNGAVLTFNNNPVTFGTVTRNTTKDQTVTVKNSGNAAATMANGLAKFTVTGTGYSLRSTTCGTALAVNNSCNVVVRFTAPNAVNSFPGTLALTSANSLPQTLKTNLTATTR